MKKYCSNCGKFHEDLGTFDSKGNFVPNNSCQDKSEEKIDYRKLNIPLAREFFVSVGTCISLLETCENYLCDFVSKDNMEITISTLKTLQEKKGW